jgi:hypothetical protein
LRARAALAAWEHTPERAIAQLREALTMAEDLGAAGECWQIEETLAALYRQQGERQQADQLVGRIRVAKERLIQGLEDEGLSSGFLTASPHRDAQTPWCR